MAKCNSTKNNGKGVKIFAVVVSILLIVCLVASLLVIGRTTNGFKEIPEFEDEEVETEGENGGLLVDSQGDADDPDYYSPLTLSVRTLSADEFKTYGVEEYALGASTVTASYSPSNASIRDFSWSLELDSTWSGYTTSGYIKDVNGTNWVQYSSFDMDDYIVLSGTDDYTVTVSCLDEFGCPINLIFTIEDVYGDVYSATCALNYESVPDVGVSISTGYSSYYTSVTMKYSEYDGAEEFVATSIKTSNGNSLSVASNLVQVSKAGSLSGLSSSLFDYKLVSCGIDGFSSVYGSFYVYYYGQKLFVDTRSIAGYVEGTYDLTSYYPTGITDYLFNSLSFIFSAAYTSDYCIGTVKTSKSGSVDTSTLGMSVDVLSGDSGSVLLSQSGLGTFSIDNCLSQMTDSKGVALTRSNFELNKVDYDYLVSHTSSGGTPLFSLRFTNDSSSYTVPFYFDSLASYFSGLSSVTLSKSGITF